MEDSSEPTGQYKSMLIASLAASSLAGVVCLVSAVGSSGQSGLPVTSLLKLPGFVALGTLGGMFIALCAKAFVLGGTKAPATSRVMTYTAAVNSAVSAALVVALGLLRV